MKSILIAIVAFLGSLGAVSGVVALRERDAILAQQAAEEAESPAPSVRPAATGALAPEPIPPEAEANTEDLPASDPPETLDPIPETTDEAPSTEEASAASGTETGSPVLQGPEDPKFSLEGSKRLAKIFSAMKASDAASVLDGLEDDAIHSILQHITDRKAAEILGNLSPERASAISQLLLESGGD